jgi:hypothetical protein
MPGWREWALSWLEDEIAFVHPQTREPYRWDRQLYWSHPEIYAGPDSRQRAPDSGQRWPIVAARAQRRTIGQ